jgi:hypothetical protein
MAHPKQPCRFFEYVEGTSIDDSELGYAKHPNLVSLMSTPEERTGAEDNFGSRQLKKIRMKCFLYNLTYAAISFNFTGNLKIGICKTPILLFLVKLRSTSPFFLN